MLHFDAALRKERRQRCQQVLDTAVATLGGKPVTEHLARLKD